MTVEEHVRIEIDYDKCIGIGSCESLAPEIFEIGDSGQVVVLQPEPGPDLSEKAAKAASSCPTEAITVI